MTSTDMIAEAIGLTGYAVEAKGIGGILKARVSDFRVDEISSKISLDPKGRFTAANITLTNWETNRFISKMARACGISRNRVFFAGTKDKRAVTKQVFVIDAPQKRVASVSISDVEIEIIGRTHQKLGFGNHKGNRFTITVRGCCNEDGTPMSEEEALSRIKDIQEKMENAIGPGIFPNWIGPQRFGSGRPVTPVVGRHVVNGDWKSAVMDYLCLEGEESEDAQEFRKMVRENGIESIDLSTIPNWLGYERDILTHLRNNTEDWIGAFKKLPNNLQLMTVHSLQSVVFNNTLKKRIEEGISLSVPVAGDLVGRIDDNGQLETSSIVTVDERTLDRISRNCKLGRLAVTSQLPGSESQVTSDEIGKLEQEVINEMNLSDSNWVIEEIGRLTTKGTRRPTTSSFSDFQYEVVPTTTLDLLEGKWLEGPKDGQLWHPEGACIRFRFTLPSGSYATTLLREFMRVPLNQL
ncbi:MAG: tRNA pseudouridine(13) synthase TruD [Euryarchaeota archaeon]